MACSCPSGGPAGNRSPCADTRGPHQIGTSRDHGGSVSRLGSDWDQRSGPKAFGGISSRRVHRSEIGWRRRGPTSGCTRRPREAEAAAGEPRSLGCHAGDTRAIPAPSLAPSPPGATACACSASGSQAARTIWCWRARADRRLEGDRPSLVGSKDPTPRTHLDTTPRQFPQAAAFCGFLSGGSPNRFCSRSYEIPNSAAPASAPARAAIA